MSDANPSKRKKLELWLLVLVVTVPVIASYALFYLWRPDSSKNYGELIQPVPLAQVIGSSPLGAQAQGKWVLVSIDSGACADTCRTKLWQMRQLRLTQGKEKDRIARAWLVDDDIHPNAELRREYEGTIILPARNGALLKHFPAAGSARDHIYLVDPLGNLMMRFPKDADPNRIKKDLIHLLKVSQVG